MAESKVQKVARGKATEGKSAGKCEHCSGDLVWAKYVGPKSSQMVKVCEACGCIERYIP